MGSAENRPSRRHASGLTHLTTPPTPPKLRRFLVLVISLLQLRKRTLNLKEDRHARTQPGKSAPPSASALRQFHSINNAPRDRTPYPADILGLRAMSCDDGRIPEQLHVARSQHIQRASSTTHHPVTTPTPPRFIRHTKNC